MDNAVDTIFDDIKAGTNVKEAMAGLKARVREHEILELDEDKHDVLISLLNSPEPKIRQSSAFCLGELHIQKSLPDLFEAYKKDETLYNKEVYAEAISKLDFKPVLDDLLELRSQLIKKDISPEERKHVTGQMRELNRTLKPYIWSEHRFTGFDLVNEAALLTNRNFKDITSGELGSIPHKDFNAGVMIKTKHLKKVLDIRTYSELLFIPDGAKELPADLKEAARKICEAGIVDYLKARHEPENVPFYFRVEYKNRSGDAREKAIFEKSFAAELEFDSKWELINSVDDYEIEFRVIESSNGSLKLLLKMCTLPDLRFKYRKQSIAVGMKPNLAALLVRLSSEYLNDNAVVMDLMCGSGIFLIERDFFKPAGMLYGIDIYGPAVNAALENLTAAGVIRKSELITRDLADFKHTHKVNEIWADTPLMSLNKDASKLAALFDALFKKADGLLEDDGHVFVYTHNRELLKKSAAVCGFMCVMDLEISKIEKSSFCVFSRK